MKRKKSRHKQAAVDFLSRISLQGYPNDTQPLNKYTSCSTASKNETALYKLHQNTSGTAFYNSQQLSRAGNFLSRNVFNEHPIIHSSEKDNLDSNKPQNGRANLQLQNLHPSKNSCVQNENLNHIFSTKTDDDRCNNRDSENVESSLPFGFELTVTNNAVGTVQPSTASRKLQHTVKSLEANEMGSRQSFALKSTNTVPQPIAARRLVISCGIHQSPLTLCSILPYFRRTTANATKTAYRTSLPVNTANTTSILGSAASTFKAGGVSTLHHRSVGNVESSSLCMPMPPSAGKAAVHSIFNSTKECIPNAGFHVTLNGTGAIYRAPHSFRQVGDEVISVAAFLRHCQPSFSTPWPNILQHFHHPRFRHHNRQCASCCNTGGGVAVDGDPNSSLQVTGYCACRSSLRYDEVMGETVAAGHVGEVTANKDRDAFAGRPIHATPSLSRRPGLVVLPYGADRSRFDSTSKQATSPTDSTLTLPLSYPDPLIHYFPNLLDDPDLLVATGRRFMHLPSYLATVLTYVRPGEQKRNVNLEFHNRFPNVQLTLTKLRSLKSVIVRIVHKLSMDLWIAAHAHVLLEKLILRLTVNKLNRKAYASAALLISAKLNDIKGSDLSLLMQEIENMFRISRRDLIHTEIDAFFNLELYVIPAESDIFPHYLRIHKDIDVAPLVPNVCINRNLLQLIPSSSVIGQHGSRDTEPG